jgi:hypothetical protein
VPRAAASFDHGGIGRKRNQSVPVDWPEQPGLLDLSEWPLAIAAEQIERSPAERRVLLREPAIEKSADVIDEAEPAQ